MHPRLPPNASFFQRLATGLNALKILAKNAADEVQGPLLNACCDLERYQALARELERTEDGRTLLTTRPSLQGPELHLEQLQALPEGTLGHAFARYFTDNKISPFTTTFTVETELDFISKRYRETHDLFHVVTGYATDPMGEMELQAFVLGNLRLPSAILILAFATPLLIKEKLISGPIAYGRRLLRAFRRGRAVRELLSVPFERWWARPVDELRSELQIRTPDRRSDSAR